MDKIQRVKTQHSRTSIVRELLAEEQCLWDMYCLDRKEVEAKVRWHTIYRIIKRLGLDTNLTRNISNQ